MVPVRDARCPSTRTRYSRRISRRRTWRARSLWAASERATTTRPAGLSTTSTDSSLNTISTFSPASIPASGPARRPVPFHWARVVDDHGDYSRDDRDVRQVEGGPERRVHEVDHLI